MHAALLFGAAAAFALSLPAQASLAGPRLFPRGARAAGVPDVRFDGSAQAYLFTLRDLGGQALVEYRLPLLDPNVQRGMLRIEETTTGFVPLVRAGLSYRVAAPPADALGAWLTPYQLGTDPANTPLLLAHGLDPATGVVTLRWRDTWQSGASAIASEKVYALRLAGRALEITATADPAVRLRADHNHAGFWFDRAEGPLPAQVLRVPYMDMVPVFAGGAPPAFCTRFLDWYSSHGSETPNTPPSVAGTTFQGETGSGYYRNDLGDLNAAIREVAYITVSRAIDDTFPVIDRPPSEYRLLLAGRMVSQHAPGNSYASGRAWVDRASSLGLDAMQHIKWDWSKWPFNLNDPDYLDPAPAPPCGTLWGSAAQFLAYAGACQQAGWGFAPYVEGGMSDPGYPNLLLQMPGSASGSVLLTPNPAYDATQCVRDAANALKKGWDTNANLAGTNLAGLGHQNDVLGPHLRPALIAQIAARIHAPGGFATGGVHLDAKTDIPCWIEIDQRAGSPFDHTIAATLRSREQFFQRAKDDMTGPLMGENSHWRYRGFETFAAGLLDGTSRKIPIHWSPAQGPHDATNWDAEVIPDFELGEVIPRATGMFGMGWEYQFQSTGFPVPLTFQDAWHTTLLSYGHAPFCSTNGDVLNNYWDWRGTLRTFWLLQGLVASMRSSPCTAVRYVDAAGAELGLSAAVAAGLDLRHPRLVLRFQSGLEFRANHAPANWVTTVLGTTYTIPTNGYVGAEPDGLLSLSAINPASGARVDYAFSPGHSEVIDRRGVPQSFAGFPGALLPVPPGLFTPPANDTQMVIVRDLRQNRAVYAAGFQTATQALGPAPTLVGLRIDADDTSTMSLGRLRLGFRCAGLFSNGTEADYTGRVRWSSNATKVATVNRLGGLSATGFGQATITASLPSLVLSATRTVTVDASPQLSALQTVALTSTQGLFTVTSDCACQISALLLVERATGAWTIAWGRPDPAQKTLVFHAQGLLPQTSYDAVAIGVNALLCYGLTPHADVVTP
ncbi:MAG: hypothetical protein FJ148_28400 [Deltaproteobacteria bacterium]|nr:hypothetical protein [Deltaproteobacteria bacterium]